MGRLLNQLREGSIVVSLTNAVPNVDFEILVKVRVRVRVRVVRLALLAYFCPGITHIPINYPGLPIN